MYPRTGTAIQALPRAEDAGPATAGSPPRKAQRVPRAKMVVFKMVILSAAPPHKRPKWLLPHTRAA